MRRVALILVCVGAALTASLFIRDQILLHGAKTRAEKEYASAKEILNLVPLAARRIPAKDYTNTTWITVPGVQLGFPADHFTRDSNPKRENFCLYHSRYRILVWSDGAGAKEFAPVMEPFAETNLYRFVRTAFNATEKQISEQPSRRALERHMLLLKVKIMMAPAGFEYMCAEFDRGDLRGFIAGDPARNKILNVLVWLESRQQFINLGLISKQPLQMSEIDELISVLKVEQNK
jgi:hypothetical protein